VLREKVLEADEQLAAFLGDQALIAFHVDG
jgi:hypothetical protein